jgi:hypothetical protein
MRSLSRKADHSREDFVRTATRILTGLALLVALAAPAAAQTPARPVSGGDDRSVLIGLGLTFLNAADQTGVGFAANGLFNVLKTTGAGNIGVVGDFGYNHFDFANVVTVMGGGRFTFNTEGKVRPYGQFIVGIVSGGGDTDFRPALGFGADVAWRENLNFRGEVLFIFLDGDTGVRWFFGVSLPFHK